MDTKILLYFDLPESFTKQLHAHNFSKHPKIPFHVTIHSIYLKPTSKMSDIVKILNRILIKPITILTQDFAEYVNDTFVITLKHNEKLQTLHECVVKNTAKHKGERETSSKNYQLNNYSPHITIGKTSIQGKNKPQELLSQPILLNTIHLHKKENDEWTKVHTFKL